MKRSKKGDCREFVINTLTRGVSFNKQNFRPLLSMRCSLSCVSNFLSCLYCCYIKLCSDEKYLLKKSEYTVQDYVTSPAQSLPRQ